MKSLKLCLSCSLTALVGCVILTQCQTISDSGSGFDSSSNPCAEETAVKSGASPATFLGTVKTASGTRSDVPMTEQLIDGIPYAVVQGDIVLGLRADIETFKGRSKGLFLAGNVKPWPLATVPYEFSADFINKRLALSAMEEFTKAQTPVRFVKRTSNQPGPYICFYNTCDADVGGRAVYGYNPHLRQHKVWINADSKKVNKTVMLHELMHSLGFGHEQCRTDAHLYVNIYKENIKGGFKDQFEPIPLSKSVGPYGYLSLTHYPRHAFAKDKFERLDTILPVSSPPNGVKPVSADSLGTQRTFSQSDLDSLQEIYGTEAAKRSAVSTTSNDN